MVIDASVWVSFYLPQDTNHPATTPFIRRVVQNRVLVFAPGLILVEIGAALARRVDQDTARRAVAQLRRLPYLRLASLDTLGVARATRTAIDCRLRGADAVYVALAQRLALPLVSWDSEHHTRRCIHYGVYACDSALTWPRRSRR